MKLNKFILFAWLILAVTSVTYGQNDSTITIPSHKKDTITILKFDMNEEIGPALWRKTQKAFDYAQTINADVILIHMNTYGGMVVSADSIRTRILNCEKPVYVFVDNNAASAGALISVACDRIYMRPGANIGAATVVNQTGEKMPDKYQSYMRSTMRATAESHGKDTIINGTDTTYKWRRDPAIAEAMVDEDVYIQGVIDTGKILTFTANEALAHGFCEGIVDNIQELIQEAALNPATIIEYQPTSLDKVIGFLVNPIFQSILIMAIFGGIYFELQTPGIGFPLGLAVTAAILYFAPLYLEGIANNWEIALFFVGVILILIEIFAIPGFGVTGISGIILAIAGLTMAMVDTFEFEPSVPGTIIKPVLGSLMLVVGSIFVSIIGSVYSSKRMFDSSYFASRITLKTSQNTNEGYIAVDTSTKLLIGKEGIADTVLRPSGSVRIDNEIYDAKSEFGFIDKGTPVKVIRTEAGQIYVVKI